jgi:plasmid stabilization system protein ParE
MKFTVVISPRAIDRLWAAARWYASTSGSMQLAIEWHDGFLARLKSLEANPERCGLSAESDNLPFEIREIYYGSGRKKTHRALFTITGSVVEVLTIRHFAERPVRHEEL